MELGKKIRKARKAKGITQRQLADAIGAKHNSISGWEDGLHKPDIDSIEFMSAVLNIGVEDLLEPRMPKGVNE